MMIWFKLIHDWQCGNHELYGLIGLFVLSRLLRCVHLDNAIDTQACKPKPAVAVVIDESGFLTTFCDRACIVDYSVTNTDPPATKFSLRHIVQVDMLLQVVAERGAALLLLGNQRTRRTVLECGQGLAGYVLVLVLRL